MDILNDILSCVTQGLDAIYPDIHAFVEEVPDDLPERCFLLGFAGNADIRRELGSRYRVSGKVDITYLFPAHGDNVGQEVNIIYATLCLRMRHLSFSDLKLRLDGFERLDRDGCLQVLCPFVTFLYEINNTPLMASIDAYLAQRKENDTP